MLRYMSCCPRETSPRSFHAVILPPQVAHVRGGLLRCTTTPVRRPGVSYGVTPLGSVLTLSHHGVPLGSVLTLGYHGVPLGSVLTLNHHGVPPGSGLILSHHGVPPGSVLTLGYHGVPLGSVLTLSPEDDRYPSDTYWWSRRF